MKNKIRLIQGLALAAVVCTTLAASSGSSTAKASVSNTSPLMGITVTNNADRPIYHLYLSPVSPESWGPDLLNQTTISKGQSFTVSDVACTGNEIKIIAEDQQGCFVYGIVSCAQANTSWTMTNDMTADCGN
ncbi:MAG: hypothetical protein ABR555_18000 [Pyrinomonadaceae bacterium]